MAVACALRVQLKVSWSMDIGTLLHCVGRDFLVSAKKVTKEHDKREAL